MVRFEFESNEMNVTFDCSLDSGDVRARARAATSSARSATAPTRSRCARTTARATSTPHPAILAWSSTPARPTPQLLAGRWADRRTTATFTFVLARRRRRRDASSARSTAPVFADAARRARSANLTEGDHTFPVRVRDAVGNVDPSPATRTWIVDLSPPDTTITSRARPAPCRDRGRELRVHGERERCHVQRAASTAAR